MTTVSHGPWWAVVLAAAVAAAVGLLTAIRLRPAGYRLDDERGPLPRLWLWPVVALPLVWGWSTWHVGWAADGAALPAHLLLGWLTVALSWIDLDVHRLPDGIVLPAYPALAGLVILASVVGDGSHWWALVGSVGLVLLFGAMWLIQPAWMGLGDVKVVGLTGMLLGWWGPGPLLVGIMVSFLIGGVQALVLLVTGRAHRHSSMAYGPSLLLGAVLVAGTGFRIVAAGSAG